MNEVRLQLIDGKFIPENAKAILTSLIKSKMEFHKNSLSAGDILSSKNRIHELEKLIEIVNEATNDAIEQKRNILVEGTITLKYTN